YNTQVIMLTTSTTGVDHIKSFEGLRLKAYDDLQPNVNITNQNQVRGVLTIGYGHTKNVYVGQVIDETQAVAYLISDLTDAEFAVRSKVKVPLTQNQFDALVSFVYNVGSGNFGSSTLLRKLNQSDYKGAADEFLRWNRAGGQVLDGLTRRRESER